jgi:hypothetical protein
MDVGEVFFGPASIFGLLQRELQKKLRFEDGADFVPASASAS